MNNGKPFTDEVRILLLKIVEQAVRDYLTLSQAYSTQDKFDYQTACNFLFDDHYYINFGGEDINLEWILYILGLEIKWFRIRLVKKKDERIRKINEEQIFMEAAVEPAEES